MSKSTNRFSSEVRAQAVRMVLDHEAEHPPRSTTATPIAEKIGCSTHTLMDRVKRAGVEAGRAAGVPLGEAERRKVLERETWELHQANEIMRKASAYFAMAEVDRPFKNDCLHRRSSRCPWGPADLPR